MKIRPHHLLCLQKYTGHGYDKAFTEKMDMLCATFVLYPDTRVTLVNGCDEICASCPNRCADRCSTEQKVRRLDELVLENCAYRYDTEILWTAAADTARKKILDDPQVFEKICGGCQWFELCVQTPLD